VKVGHEATLVADAYPDATYKARIQSISPATGAEFALLPPQNASGNWVKVVQRVPVRLMVLEDANQPRLRAGMTVTVTIDTERERSLGLIVAEWLDDSGAGSFVPAAVTAWLRSS
jgi:membrane fusion protein (multidrug efflux system)